jgi:hypothetical protein
MGEDAGARTCARRVLPRRRNGVSCRPRCARALEGRHRHARGARRHVAVARRRSQARAPRRARCGPASRRRARRVWRSAWIERGARAARRRCDRAPVGRGPSRRPPAQNRTSPHSLSPVFS